MTPDSLKQARAKEAVRLAQINVTAWLVGPVQRAISKYQHLIDIDWHPPEPINPDLIEARECCALVAEAMGAHGFAVEYREGRYDDQLSIQPVLLAIERAKGREAGS